MAKSHPMTTPVEVVERICGLALLHPAYGCNRLEALLALEGRRVSAITIQKILNERELGRREAALAGARDKTARRAGRATAEQIAFLEKLNPCFSRAPHRERAAGRAALGRHFMVGTLEGHRPGLSARRGRHLWLLRVRLPARLEATGGGGGGPAQRRAAVLPHAGLPVTRRAHRQRPRVLRHRAPSVRALPGARRDRAPKDPGRLTPRTNGFVERFNGTVLGWSSFARPCTGGSTRASRPCRPTSTPGCTTTTTSDRISATATRADDPGTRSSVSSVKKVKRTPDRTQLIRCATVILKEAIDALAWPQY